MLAVKLLLAAVMIARGATVSLPDATMAAPAGAPAQQALPPAAGAAAAAPPALREITPAPVLPNPFLDALRMVNAQLKVIEAKGRSLSSGLPFRRGRLRNPAQLPVDGFGYRSIRVHRGLIYGTDDLVTGLIQVCAKLQQQDPKTPSLAVGDLSGPKGGKRGHRSHQNGRDADLVFYWLDDAGNPVPAEEFVRFDKHGKGSYKGKRVWFDTRRNWRLVRELIKSPVFGDRVQALFVHKPLKKILLGWGERMEGDLYVLERAREVLKEAGRRAGRHDDHFHLRIRCSESELLEGCKDPAPKVLED